MPLVVNQGRQPMASKNHNWEVLCRDQLEDQREKRIYDVIANGLDHLQYGAWCMPTNMYVSLIYVASGLYCNDNEINQSINQSTLQLRTILGDEQMTPS